MGNELKTCPFCGTTDHLSNSPCGSLTEDMPARPHRVVCNHIDCEYVQGPVSYGALAAIAAWNQRAPIADKTHHCTGCKDRIDELEAELNNAKKEKAGGDQEEWGCDHCRNDGRLTALNACPKCDAQYEEKAGG